MASAFPHTHAVETGATVFPLFLVSANVLISWLIFRTYVPSYTLSSVIKYDPKCWECSQSEMYLFLEMFCTYVMFLRHEHINATLHHKHCNSKCLHMFEGLIIVLMSKGCYETTYKVLTCKVHAQQRQVSHLNGRKLDHRQV
jgi:hypothetical protein